MESNFRKTNYKELARMQMSETRSLVISKNSRGGYTIAQQLEVIDDGARASAFLKGAIHIDDLDELIKTLESAKEIDES